MSTPERRCTHGFIIVDSCVNCWACLDVCPSNADYPAPRISKSEIQSCTECVDFTDPQCANICPIEEPTRNAIIRSVLSPAFLRNAWKTMREYRHFASETNAQANVLRKPGCASNINIKRNRLQQAAGVPPECATLTEPWTANSLAPLLWRVTTGAGSIRRRRIKDGEAETPFPIPGRRCVTSHAGRSLADTPAADQTDDFVTAGVWLAPLVAAARSLRRILRHCWKHRKMQPSITRTTVSSGGLKWIPPPMPCLYITAEYRQRLVT